MKEFNNVPRIDGAYERGCLDFFLKLTLSRIKKRVYTGSRNYQWTYEMYRRDLTMNREEGEPCQIDVPSDSTSTGILRPPLRWAGGKSGIVKDLISLMPARYTRYVEPMAGSAALFFGAKPERALLADVNEDLINYFTILRNDLDRLTSSLFKMTASKDKYYSLREQQPSDFMERAIRFAYLNRLCWNGVYRVNSLGMFNVPIGSRLPKVLWIERHLRECSRVLFKAELFHSTVLDTLARSEPNDFFFIDPPYPKGANAVGNFGTSIKL